MSALPPPPAFRRLGPDGPQVSSIAWGMWRLAETASETATLVHAAVDAGINLLDTADIYGFDGDRGFGEAEALLGQVLGAEPALRNTIVLATKGGISPPVPYDQSRAYLQRAIDDSLRRLRVERIDLYQIHRPDVLTHPAEVAEALVSARAAGKIDRIGVSNMTVPQIDTLARFLEVPIASTQPEISPLRIDCFENGELDQAIRIGLTPLAWSPLGGGRLAQPVTARDQSIAAALDKVAQPQGVSRAVAAYSWLMAHPAGIIPIIGSQRPERVAEAMKALDVRWTREDWYAVFVAARGEKLP